MENISSKKNSLPDCFYRITKNLKANQNIIISRSDKGNQIVILNKIDYINKSLSLLNDTNTYTHLKTNPLKTSQTQFNKKLKLLFNNHHDLFIKLKSHNSQLAKFYGIPKTHKQDIPLRPIISNTNCITFKLSKWISNQLKPLLGKISNSHIKNSATLKNTISNLNMTNMDMVSFDVTSLFTNVPVSDALSLLQTHISNTHFTFEVPFDIIKSLILLVTEHSHFSFNNKYYTQKEGLSMGSPLSPIISCLYLELLERYFFYPSPLFSNTTWLRYVDDVLFIHPKSTNINNVHTFINSIKPSIKFTLEKATNNTLPFLDLLIDWNTPTSLVFSVYQKPTHKPKYVHWYSSHKLSIKLGIITTLSLRAHRLCSPSTLQNEINNIKTTFTKLAYPLKIIYKGINKAKTIYSRNYTTPQENTYQHKNTLTLNTNLNLKFNNLQIVNKYNNTFKKIFKPNIKTTSELSGIYAIPCRNCNNVYIGESSDIKRRQYQHSYDLRTYHTESPLIAHQIHTAHAIDSKDLTVIKHTTNHNKRKLLESYAIHNTNNYNRDRGSYTMDHLLSSYLRVSPSIRSLNENIKKWEKNTTNQLRTSA